MVKDFFIIDSNNLGEVRDSIFGFVVTSNGIFDEDNFAELNDEDATGIGTYLIVRSTDDHITIKQDYSGSWGLYFYRNQDYFAISNSVVALGEYLKGHRILTLNRDYANHMLLEGLASRALEETVFSEVSLIRRNAKVVIHKGIKPWIEFDYIDYGENTVYINSREGIDALDKWCEKWRGIIRGLVNNAHVEADLSGGFDSRVVFSLLPNSGIDLKDIRVNSYKDKYYTHSEDYAIASKIADEFGFALNCGNHSEQCAYYCVDELMERQFLTKLSVNKQFFFLDKRYKTKRIKLTGDGGESIRGVDTRDKKNFIKLHTSYANVYSDELKNELSVSDNNILNHLYDYINTGANIEPDSAIATYAVCRETWNRSHFGKKGVECFFNNIYGLQPLMDPDLHRIIPITKDCKDFNLLMAVIIVRYCPKLLDFPYDSNHVIDKRTIEYARKLSDSYKYSIHGTRLIEQFSITLLNKEKLKLSENSLNAKSIAKEKVLEFCRSNGRFKDLFLRYFSEELLNYAHYYADTNMIFALTQYYAILGIVWAISCVEYSRYANNQCSFIEELNRFAQTERPCYRTVKEFGFPYSRVEKNSRIILYGAGNWGKRYKEQLDKSEYCQVVKWVDKNYSNIGEGVENVESIKNAEYDYVVVAIYDKSVRREIIGDLILLGVDNNSIVFNDFLD